MVLQQDCPVTAPITSFIFILFFYIKEQFSMHSAFSRRTKRALTHLTLLTLAAAAQPGSGSVLDSVKPPAIHQPTAPAPEITVKEQPPAPVGGGEPIPVKAFRIDGQPPVPATELLALINRYWPVWQFRRYLAGRRRQRLQSYPLPGPSRPHRCGLPGNRRCHRSDGRPLYQNGAHLAAPAGSSPKPEFEPELHWPARR
ncbi:MAG: hypothetical protein H6Q71_502 [Firmicutes bacterium]|nr:hypothetical protein [Bacillota bacterium]